MGMRAFAYDVITENLKAITTDDGYSVTIVDRNIVEFVAPNHRWDESRSPLFSMHYLGEDFVEAGDQGDTISLAFQLNLFARNTTHQNFLEVIDDVHQALSLMGVHPTGHTVTNGVVHRVRVNSVETGLDITEAVDGKQQASFSIEVIIGYAFQDHAEQ
jgi:hypothetical protein